MKTFLKPLIITCAVFFCLFLAIGFKASAASLICTKWDGDGNCIEGTCAQAPDSPVCKADAHARNSGQNDNIVLTTINKAIDIIASVAGLAALIIIIIAGFSYVTSGGNAEQAKNARNRIIYAAVGLVIIASSWAITSFILDKVL
jgi:hypothetical protein